MSILKKSLSGVLSLFIISLGIFFLSKLVPGDPVEASLGVSPEKVQTINYEKEYLQKKKELNLHLPYFYFALTPKDFPSNIHAEGSKAVIREKREKLMKISSLWPSFHWYGKENQYHKWLFEANTSILDGKPVRYKIGRSLVWTSFLVIFSITLSYFFAILIGMFLSSLKSSRLKRFITTTLFGIYAIPVFLMATLLLIFFTTSEYGAWTNIFPTVGLAPIDFGEEWYVRLGKFGGQLILPSLVLVLHNLAFLSMLTKKNLDKNRQLAFVRTSMAYGFSSKEILYKEVLPLSLIPLITSVSSALPAAIGGSLVLEIIFNIPGIGRLLYTSILNYDWPVVFPIVLIIACATYLSFLLADIFYKIADPRMR